MLKLIIQRYLQNSENLYAFW